MHRFGCVVVIGALAVAVSVVAAGPAAAAKGGNRDNAHACQQGGHENRFEAETGRAFKNAGDCASHGAQGGDTSSLGIDNSGTYPCRPPDQALNCWGTLSGSGLKPGAQWTVCLPSVETCVIHVTGTATAGGTIDAVQLFLLCGASSARGAQAKSTTSSGQEITSPSVHPPSSC
jgi:hypothetical protein